MQGNHEVAQNGKAIWNKSVLWKAAVASGNVYVSWDHTLGVTAKHYALSKGKRSDLAMVLHCKKLLNT